MKTFFRTLIAVLVADLLIVIALGIVIISKLKDDVDVKSGTVLVQTISGPITEYAPPSSGLPFGDEPETHTTILENLEKARHDKRIEAVVLRLGYPEMGFAKRDELRDRIAQLRRSGIPVWAYTESLTGQSLFIGAACDSLFLLPGGYVSLRGFRAERRFFKGTLDKLGIKENLHKIENYKAAAELLQREDMSAGARENINWILDDLYPHWVSAIEADRGLAAGSFEGDILARGAMVPREALELNLVDHLASFDEIASSLLGIKGVKEAEKDSKEDRPRPRTISGADYAEVSREDAGIKVKKTIAIVHAQGFMLGGTSGMNPLLGMTLGAATMEKSLQQAATNKDVEAIILRIDSGGGESTAAYRMSRAVRLADGQKPMVVSMCDVAGSGGYHIAHPCSTLIANSHSIVGSIGSISGKLNLRGLYDKLGITKDFVTRGPMALMESEYFDYTPEEYEAFADRHWRDYMDWVEQIALDRGMAVADVDSAGRGRTFTGEQALARGLVDQIGGFDQAVRVAKEKAGIPPEEEVEFVHYPEKKGPLEALKSGGFAALVYTLVQQIVGPIQHDATWAVDPTTYR
jgi:protease-4